MAEVDATAGASSSGNVDRCTVYAKAFSKSTTQDRVRDTFQLYGQIRHVRLRREAATNSFRGSVYVEFEEEASALKACQDPPTGITVMLKSDYEQLRNASSSAQHGSLGQGQKRLKQDNGTPVSTQDTPWQRSGDEKDARIATLEEQLQTERETSKHLQQRLQEAQQRSEELAGREQAAQQKLLSKEIEVGSLKGEIQAVRNQSKQAQDAMALQYKARLADLEGQVGRLKDQLQDRQRQERESSRRAAGTRTPPPAEEDLLEGL